MINGTSMLGKHNPRWPIGNATETVRFPDLPSPRGPSLPHRAGGRVFAMNDEEARWRGWQVTELAGGLARQYRDRRFDTHRVRYSPRYGEG